MKKIVAGLSVLFLLITGFKATKVSESVFTDPRDGQTYNTVKIGDNVWMAENLNYRTDSGSWCYKNDPKNCKKYGRLYNWEAAKNASPLGWHLPTKEEWRNLINRVNKNSNALKAEGVGEGIGVGTNTSGFSAVLGGIYLNNNNFIRKGYLAHFWSASTNDRNYAFQVYFSYGSKQIFSEHAFKEFGSSVRCIKDR